MCAVGLRNLQSESYVAFVKKGYAITLTNVLGKTFLALSAIFNFEYNLIKSTSGYFIHWLKQLYAKFKENLSKFVMIWNLKFPPPINALRSIIDMI